MNREQIAELIVTGIERNQTDVLKQWSHPVGTTTRHFVIDAFLPLELARTIYHAFPPDGAGLLRRSSFREHKRTSRHLSSFPGILIETSFAFQHYLVLEKIAFVTGIKNVEADPLFYAGGLSMMFQGDFLNPHVDNSHDSKRTLYRRLNLLYYVSPDWALENGGNFELWDEHVTSPKTIVSSFNRLVVMETTPTSFHSVNRVRLDRPRCCVSNYFFSKDSPTGDEYFHITSFLARPDQKGLRALSYVDNFARTIAARALGGGRGRQLVKLDGSK